MRPGWPLTRRQTLVMLLGIAGQTETCFVHLHFEMHERETGPDWMRGRLDPLLVLGPLADCGNSAAPPR